MVGRTPLDEGSARCRDICLTTNTTLTRERHPCPRRDLFSGDGGWEGEFWSPSLGLSLHFFHTCLVVLIVLACAFVFTLQHITQTSMPPEGFEPAIPASDRPQTLASGIGKWTPYSNFVHYFTSCRWLEWWHRVAVTGTNGSHITRCHTVKMLSGGLSSMMRTETEGWVSLSLVEVTPVGLELGRISIVQPHVNLM